MSVLINQVFLVCLVALLNLAAIPAFCQQDNIQTINQIWAAGNTAFQAGDIKEAEERIAEFIRLVPFEPSSRILMARCHAKLGDIEGAVASLSRACDLGWEDVNVVKGYPELEVLHHMPAVAKVFASMEENGKRQFVSYAGKSVDKNKAVPLIVLYHGRGELPAIQLHFWKEAADRAGWMILAPKGTRKVGGGYAWERPGAERTWDIDTDAIVAKTRSQISEFIESKKVSAVVVAGFSQGGVAAFDVLCSKLMPCPAGGLLFSTAFPEKLDKKFREESCVFKGRIIVHVGQNDHWSKGNQAVVEVLQQRGATATIRIWEGIGHQMPPNHTRVIIESVGDILQSQAENDFQEPG